MVADDFVRADELDRMQPSASRGTMEEDAESSDEDLNEDDPSDADSDVKKPAARTGELDAALPNAPSAELESRQSKRLRIPAKFRNKKPADMPRRPLSAYNLFFRDQRAQIIAERAQGSMQTSSEGLFESMAKTIAARWKCISKEELARYTDLASEDTCRYRSQMERYNKKFVEDRSLAAKQRRAENRKRKQREKAELKSLDSSGTFAKASSVLRHSNDHESSFNSQSFTNLPSTFLTIPSYHSQSLSQRTQPTGTSASQFSTDLQMRLLAAHAEGLSRAIPATPNAQISDYLRQLNQNQATPSFQRSAPSYTGITGHEDSTNEGLLNEGFGSATATPSNPIASAVSESPHDPLSILQLIQQQQSSLRLSSTQTELEGLLALQDWQRSGQPIQLPPPTAPYDLSLEVLLQLQQRQQQQNQQQQVMARWNADANFYQQQQQQEDRRNDYNQSQWQFPGSNPPNNYGDQS